MQKPSFTYLFDEDDPRPLGLAINGVRVKVATVPLKLLAEREVKRKSIRPALEKMFPDLKPVEDERLAVQLRNQELLRSHKEATEAAQKAKQKGNKLPKLPKLEELPELPPAYAAFERAMQCWPGIAVATVKIEVLDAQAPVKDEAEAWREASLSELGLHEPEGVLEWPENVIQAWDAAARGANEQLFSVDQSEDAKKKGTLFAV